MARAVGQGALGRGGPREPRRAGPFLEALVLIAILVAAGLGQRFFDGRTALEWTRYHASGRPQARPLERGRQTGRWAARAVDRMAPLPPSGEALRLALAAGRELLPAQPAAALALCAELQPTLARLERDPWRRRPGAAAALAEVESLQAEARARSTSPGAARLGGRP